MGVVTANAQNSFDVTGTHTYAEEGTYSISVLITDKDNSQLLTISVAEVAEAGLGGAPATPNQAFVAELYENVLEREPDASGLAFWSSVLDQGTMTRQQVALDILQSGESQSRLVQDFYAGLLNRSPDAAGLNSATNYLSHGGTPEGLIVGLAGSPEYFQNRGGNSNDGFLDAIFHDLLNRDVDPATRALFDQELAGGASPAVIVQQIVSGAEFQQDLVKRFYVGTLGRVADSAGFSAFLQQIQQGAPDTQVLATLLGSGEFAIDAGGNANQLYVAQLYRDLLQREADPPSLAFFTAQLDSGALSRAQVVQTLVSSPEFRAVEVQAQYEKFLKRPADAGSVGAFSNFLAQGGTVEQIDVILTGSPEYFHNRGGGTNDGFLTALYSDVLNRSVDAPSRTAWDQALATGTTPGQVAAVFFQSPEYDQDLVKSFYQTYLHRPADNGSLNSFANALQSGIRDEVLVALLTSSTEYFTHS
jgi:hypothetical protein